MLHRCNFIFSYHLFSGGLQLRLELGNVVTGEGERGEWWVEARRIKCGRGSRRV
jgi:hypothetical protein